jgi:hypothetical protein
LVKTNAPDGQVADKSDMPMAHHHGVVRPEQRPSRDGESAQQRLARLDVLEELGDGGPLSSTPATGSCRVSWTTTDNS